jgi:hypothetical protein
VSLKTMKQSLSKSTSTIFVSHVALSLTLSLSLSLSHIHNYIFLFLVGRCRSFSYSFHTKSRPYSVHIFDGDRCLLIYSKPYMNGLYQEGRCTFRSGFLNSLIPSHFSTFYHTIHFIFFKKKKHIKSFTFYITSFTIQIKKLLQNKFFHFSIPLFHFSVLIIYFYFK